MRIPSGVDIQSSGREGPVPRYFLVSQGVFVPPETGRFAALDVGRGMALILMAIYHAAWDLAYFRFVDLPLFSDPGWIFFPRFIAASFLLIVGAGLALWWRAGANRRRFLRRLAILAVCAGAISIGTRIAFGPQYVFFGILHCIAVGSLLALPFLRLPKAAAFLGAGLFMAGPFLFSGPVFNSPEWLWLGLMTYRPSSVDFVPLFPWFGWILLGLGLVRWGLEPGRSPRSWADWRPGGGWAGLAWLGRHSLAFYLIHQPVLFGIAYGTAIALR
jgi:uncharacterized membrane protein